MTNSSGHELGRRGPRRLAVLVVLAGVAGALSLGSASPASAAFNLCKGSVEPASKSNPGASAKLSFSCNQELRGYGIVSTKQLADYTDVPLVAGSPSLYLNCEGGVPASGFGCGIKNRNTPNNCGQSTTVLPAVTNGPPAVAAVTGPPCIQKIPPDNVISQTVTLASDPCTYKSVNPLKVFLIAGNEPSISSFTTRGDTVTVGEYTTEPFPLKVKGYSGCQPGEPKKPAEESKSGKGTTGPSPKKSAGAQTSASVFDHFPGFCAGKVEPKDPAKPSIDAKYDFTCNMNIRGYTITSNKQLDFFGFENEVYAPNGTGSTESATLQCEGPIPSPGFGCGITNRQTATNRLSAQNNLRSELGFPVNPCKREPGEPRTKIWLTVLGEPTIIGPPNTTGFYVSEPFLLPLEGYGPGECVKPKAKSN